MPDTTENFEFSESDPQKPKGWGCRHTLAFLGFLGFTLLHGMRVSMSLAIVAMVDHDRNIEVSDTYESVSVSVPVPNSNVPESNPIFLRNQSEMISDWTDYLNLTAEARTSSPVILDFNQSSNHTPTVKKSVEKYNLDSKSQGLVLGAIYWGSLVSKIPGGLVAQRFGGKWPLGLAMLGVSTVTLLIPLLASLNWHLLLVARAAQGLFDGLCSPSMHTLLAKWAPPNERSKLATIIYAGGQLGTAVMMVSSGHMIDAGFLGGWPGPFYVTGTVGFIWAIVWMIISRESPSSSKSISTAELIYIQKCLGDRVISKKKNLNVPWRNILTSLPVWAIIIANTADAWGFYTFLTELPTYMKTVLHFNIKANSLLSALPYLISWGFSIALTQFADYLISSKKFKIIVVRKACETIGHLGSAVCLVAASYASQNKLLTVALVTIGISINGATYGGYAVNHVDIAPNHAGVLLGFTSTIANICGIAAPYVAGLLINDHPSLENWQLVFFLTAAIYLFDTIFFLVFATDEVQTWDKHKEEDEDTEKEMELIPKPTSS